MVRTVDNLADLWTAAVEVEPPPPTKALGFGVNFRIDIKKLFHAAWETFKACVELAVVHGNPTDPVAIAKAGEALYQAAQAVLASIHEKMNPLEYVGCLMLASADGLRAEDFEDRLRVFLTSTGPTYAPSYLGLSDKRLAAARELFAAPGAFADLLALLSKNRWLDQRNGLLHFKPRHVTLGITET
jgi:hypothetical protein